MAQLRRVCIWVAILASIVALVAGVILFFVVEPPLLASIFLASSLVSIACFGIAAATAYFID